MFKIKAEEFTKVLKEEIASNPAIKGSNYDIVRENVSRQLKMSKKEFDEILGYMIGTGRLENVWLFTGGRQAKIYHKNMWNAVIEPFDSIEEMGRGIRYIQKEKRRLPKESIFV